LILIRGEEFMIDFGCVDNGCFSQIRRFPICSGGLLSSKDDPTGPC